MDATGEINDDDLDNPEEMVLASESEENSNDQVDGSQQIDGKEQIQDNQNEDSIDGSKETEGGHDSQNGDTDDCFIQLKFSNSKSYMELKDIIGKTITDAMFSQQKSVQITEISATYQLNIQGIPMKDCMFIVDSEPAIGETAQSIPKYSKNIKTVINDIVETQTDDNVRKAPKPKSLCFNCDGDHTLRDCTLPKDNNKIRQNRSKYSTGKVERYHVDIEQRFGQFVPGEISNDLRTALGLHKLEIPVHVYNMRVYGYPPGWLENAKVQKSGLTLFDSKVCTLSFFHLLTLL